MSIRGGSLGAIGALVVLLGLADGALAQPTIQHRVAVLQGLDKVSARIEVLEAPVDQEIRFGSLAIRARACYETPPTEPPESAAFLEIDHLGSDDSRDAAFVGWMFASTPGISALEHPVFDVWVIDCREPTITVPLELPVEPAPQQ
jgi:hypothetical protein